MSDKKDSVLFVRIDADLKKKIEKSAKAENRSVSNWVLTVLKEKIGRAEHGR